MEGHLLEDTLSEAPTAREAFDELYSDFEPYIPMEAKADGDGSPCDHKVLFAAGVGLAAAGVGLAAAVFNPDAGGAASILTWVFLAADCP